MLIYSEKLPKDIVFNGDGMMKSYREFLGCLGVAVLGVDIAGYIYGAAGRFGYQTALRLLARSFTRALGIIGAAIAIVSFVDCMGWVNVGLLANNNDTQPPHRKITFDEYIGIT
jgi:hypothetical protein